MTMVNVYGFTRENYHKHLASLSERQVHSSTPPIKTNGWDVVETGNYIGMTIDPKDFPEMDRFVVCIQKSNKE